MVKSIKLGEKSLLALLSFLMPCFATSAQPFLIPEDWQLVRQVEPDLWLVERYECRGSCTDEVKHLLEEAKNKPQSFSDPGRRSQYDFLNCAGQLGLWMKKTPIAQALKAANGLVRKRYQSDARGWGFQGTHANNGFVVCLNPDGSFDHAFTLLDYRDNQIVAFVIEDFLVYYKPVSGKTR